MKYTIVSLTLSLLAFSCSSHNDGDSSPDYRNVAQSDRDSLINSVDSNQLTALDAHTQNSITTFFGGSNGSDFQNFFDNRIHYFLNQSDYADLEDNTFGGKYGRSSSVDPDDGAMKKAGIHLAASNIGISLWIISLIEGDLIPVNFNFRGHSLILDTPHVGLMLIGEGYNMTAQLDDGSTYTFPKASRQATLIHEARHSDCATGLNQADLDFMKPFFEHKDSSLADKFKKMTCGNLHSICPAYHEYHGFAACDSMPWGAYTAGAMFASLSAKSQNSYVDKKAMEMVAADQLSRLLIDSGDMFDGKLGPPNLENHGFISSPE